MRSIFQRINAGRFERLEAFARTALAELCLDREANELALDLEQCLAATSDQQSFAARAAEIFAPFEGHWLGGDLHDPSRAFRHIWYPTQIEGDFAGQRVVMIDARDRRTQAYNFCEIDDAPRITGLVGDRAHRGFALPGDALLWVGEERDGQVSLHMERVWADGQLYDVRGMVLAPPESHNIATVCVRSDWRYHRLTDGAVQIPSR